MKKFILRIAWPIAITLNSQPATINQVTTSPKAWRYEYNEICFFNNLPKKCAVNFGYVIPLTSGSDVDIYWQDGQTTSIKYAEHDGPLEKGAKALINGKYRGTVSRIFNITRAGKEIDNHAEIRVSNGDTLSYQYIAENE